MKKLLWFLIIIVLITFIPFTGCSIKKMDTEDVTEENIEKDSKSENEVKIKESEEIKEELQEENENAEKENIKEEVAKVDIETEEIYSSEEWLEEGLQIPVISGMKNKDTQKQINNMFKEDIIMFAKEYEETSKRDYEESKKQEYEFRKYLTQVSYEVKKNSNSLLSIYVIYYYYTGGAHGMHDDVTYNIDIETGKLLELKDFFQEGYDYVSVINDEIKSQIKMVNEEEIKRQLEQGIKPGEVYKIYEQFDTIDEEQAFFVTDDEIGIYFGLYEIAPYAAGIPTFPINIGVLKDGLSDRAKKYFNIQ